MGLTSLGIFHTIIGLIAIGAAIVSYVKYGKINLAQLSGKLYFYGTVITALTALGISKTGKFHVGHILSLFVFVLVVAAFVLFWRMKGNKIARYFENFFLSFSFFLSLLPTVNETFTRVPIGHPFARDINDPLISRTILIILMLFVVGSIYQVIYQRKINRTV
jgi:hypothetical protein